MYEQYQFDIRCVFTVECYKHKLFKLYDRCVFAGGQQSAVGQGSE